MAPNNLNIVVFYLKPQLVWVACLSCAVQRLLNGGFCSLISDTLIVQPLSCLQRLKMENSHFPAAALDCSHLIRSSAISFVSSCRIPSPFPPFRSVSQLRLSLSAGPASVAVATVAMRLHSPSPHMTSRGGCHVTLWGELAAVWLGWAGQTTTGLSSLLKGNAHQTWRWDFFFLV